MLFSFKHKIVSSEVGMYKCTGKKIKYRGKYLRNTEWRGDRNVQKVIFMWSKAEKSWENFKLGP